MKNLKTKKDKKNLLESLKFLEKNEISKLVSVKFKAKMLKFWF
jgi:hypothetical protein